MHWSTLFVYDDFGQRIFMSFICEGVKKLKALADAEEWKVDSMYVLLHF